MVLKTRRGLWHRVRCKRIKEVVSPLTKATA